MASGRIVVVAVVEGLLALVALVGGLGPFAEPGTQIERLVGAAAIVLALPMAAGAALLLARRGPARAGGLVAAGATVALGGMVTALGISSFDACGDARHPWSCSVVTGIVTLVGIGVVAFAIASGLIVRRAHPQAFRHQDR